MIIALNRQSPVAFGLNILLGFIFCLVIWACLLSPVTAHSTTSHAIAILDEPKYPEGFKHFDYVNPEAPKKGIVKLASLGTYDNLNPFILKGIVPEGIELTFDTLMTSPADEAATSYGLIAESVQMPEDRSWVIFRLRKIAKWSDGTAITADDVVFSFNTLIKEGHPQYQLYYQDVANVKKLGKYKVKFTFKHTTNRELPLVVGQLPIISKAYYSKHPFNQTTLTPPISNGPYQITKLQAGRFIVYQRNPHYWGKNLPVNTGRYNFDQIRFDYYRDDTVAVEALKAGEYDFRRENIAKTWANSYNLPHLKDGRMKKEELADGTPTGMQCFAFNTRRSLFSNAKVREALNYAYDFEWANKQLFFSAYARNTSYFGNSEYASSGLPSQEERALLQPYQNILPKQLFTTPYAPPTTIGTGDIRNNLIKAQELLNEAGWVIKDMKRIDPATGKPATIEFLLVSPSFERVVAPYIRNLKKLGIDASIRTVDASQYIKRREQFDFDVIVHWFTQGNAPGNEQYNYWHSKVADQPGSFNLAGIKNPAVDALVEQIIAAKTKEELVTTSRALDRILLWNYYSIPQWHSRSHRVIYWNKFGRPNKTPPYSLAFLDTWWVK